MKGVIYEMVRVRDEDDEIYKLSLDEKREHLKDIIRGKLKQGEMAWLTFNVLYNDVLFDIREVDGWYSAMEYYICDNANHLTKEENKMIVLPRGTSSNNTSVKDGNSICTCPLSDLMARGCKCGAMEKERCNV